MKKILVDERYLYKHHCLTKYFEKKNKNLPKVVFQISRILVLVNITLLLIVGKNPVTKFCKYEFKLLNSYYFWQMNSNKCPCRHQVSQMNFDKKISSVLIFAKSIKIHEIRENYYHTDVFLIN